MAKFVASALVMNISDYIFCDFCSTRCITCKDWQEQDVPDANSQHQSTIIIAL